MSELIGGTYEVVQRLGSGGGGVVYLANHIRLNKQVVLKADKRKITTRPELLRREVDVLKNLNHPYIPQVYDFFAEDETVYTAMDFVEGESLDKPLKRGERFSQPQVVKWAIQLLEALDYLHSPTHGTPPRGYVHSDIKPANIMLRTNGDICLIDFNISLALGEENVIGASAGYASPEHYGLDFSFSSATATVGDATVPLDDETRTLTMAESRSTYTRQKNVMPDVRSDIYSAGATLYHLLSGRRPAKNAVEVAPLTAAEVSPQIAAIISRAMDPNPDLRYQTAAEMLRDFEHLHENDPRARRLRRQKRLTIGAFAALFLCGGAMAFAGSTQLRRAEEAARMIAEQEAEQERVAKEAEQNAKDALELIGASRDALRLGDGEGAKKYALEALGKSTQYDASAQYALSDALGVYDLSDGFKADKAVALPSEAIKQSVSPSGKFAAILTSGRVSVVELASGEIVAGLAANVSALSDMVFTADDTLLYAGEDALCAVRAADGSALWSAEGAVTAISVSEDGRVAAAARGDGEGAEVYDARTGERIGSLSFGGLRRNGPVNAVFADPNDDVFALSPSGRYLAVSFANGALKLFDLYDFADGEIEIFDASDYTVFEGGFYDHYFGFAASDGADSDFFVIDTTTLTMAGSLSVGGEMHLRVDPDGFCLAQGGVLVRLDVESGEQKELAYTESGIAAMSRSGGLTLVKAADGKLLFYDANAILFDRHDDIPCDFLALAGEYALLSGRDSQSARIMRLVSHTDRQLFTYDAGYSHDEARVSSDRATVMLYGYRGFRLYDMDGGLIAEHEIPDAAQVYDQQYRRGADGDRLEVVYNDGLVRAYSAADGTLLSETQGEKRNDSLDEEFLTDKLRITSPLHGTPAVYDRESGALLGELETDDYLTYVTEVEGGLITEYITSQGQRYGLLLNDELETLARLPNLCDILPDGTLAFDDMRGNLRQSRVYSAQELTALAAADQA